MTEEKNQSEKTQTIVELQVLPCANEVAQTKQNVEVLNHENQDDPPCGKIILTVTCNGSKLTKADSGLVEEFQEEVWVTVKTTKADAGIVPNIDLSVHERCTTKMTKADSGIA